MSPPTWVLITAANPCQCFGRSRVLQEYLLQRNVFIPCLPDGESLSHCLPWSIAPRTPTAWTAPCCTISHVWSDKKLLRGGRLIHAQLSCSSNKKSHEGIIHHRKMDQHSEQQIHKLGFHWICKQARRRREHIDDQDFSFQFCQV